MNWSPTHGVSNNPSAKRICAYTSGELIKAPRVTSKPLAKTICLYTSREPIEVPPPSPWVTSKPSAKGICAAEIVYTYTGGELIKAALPALGLW